MCCGADERMGHTASMILMRSAGWGCVFKWARKQGWVRVGDELGRMRDGGRWKSEGADRMALIWEITEGEGEGECEGWGCMFGGQGAEGQEPSRTQPQAPSPPPLTHTQGAGLRGRIPAQALSSSRRGCGRA